MSEKLLVKEAKRRAEVFKNLNQYLKILIETVREMDRKAETYLFGSVAEGKYLLSSDIDILVVTDLPPGEILSKLWLKGIKDPFEIHIVGRNMLEIYKRRAKLLKVENLLKEQANKVIGNAQREKGGSK